jgi:hypothetical protein
MGASERGKPPNDLKGNRDREIIIIIIIIIRRRRRRRRRIE